MWQNLPVIVHDRNLRVLTINPLDLESYATLTSRAEPTTLLKNEGTKVIYRGCSFVSYFCRSELRAESKSAFEDLSSCLGSGDGVPM